MSLIVSYRTESHERTPGHASSHDLRAARDSLRKQIDAQMRERLERARVREQGADALRSRQCDLAGSTLWSKTDSLGTPRVQGVKRPSRTRSTCST